MRMLKFQQMLLIYLKKMLNAVEIRFYLLHRYKISVMEHAYDFCILQYLLAMVFAYFKRANLAEKEYTRLNFFAALWVQLCQITHYICYAKIMKLKFMKNLPLVQLVVCNIIQNSNVWTKSWPVFQLKPISFYSFNIF